MLDLDSKIPTSFAQGTEEKLELNVSYHYMLDSFKAIFGKTVTLQWHFGNGPERQATSFHMSCEGLGQGDAPATMYFNVLAAIVYTK